MCKEVCNRIEGHLPPCAAHRQSTVPKGFQQHWQPGEDGANFNSSGKVEKVGLHLGTLLVDFYVLKHNSFSGLERAYNSEKAF